MTDTTRLRPGFTEDWFGLNSRHALAGLVRDVWKVDGLLVEVGAWEGRSTIAMANAATHRTIHSVDTWQGSPGEISESLAATRDVFSQWQLNVAEWTEGNIEPHQMPWREYVDTITEPVALLMIDAEHTYREVFDTIEAFLPHMAEGGIMCGDDVHYPPIVQAVNEWFDLKQVEVHATLWVVRL